MSKPPHMLSVWINIPPLNHISMDTIYLYNPLCLCKLSYSSLTWHRDTCSLPCTTHNQLNHSYFFDLSRWTLWGWNCDLKKRRPWKAGRLLSSSSMGFWNRSWSIIYWLPTGIFLSHSIYNIKVISGPSMQVRSYSSSISLRTSIQDVLASQPSILILLLGETLQYSIVLLSIHWDNVIVTILLPYGQSFILFILFLSFEQHKSSPENPNRMLVKRILALEGDVVKTLPPYPDKEIVVPQGHVWVEGLILQVTFFTKGSFIIQEWCRRRTFLQWWQ